MEALALSPGIRVDLLQGILVFFLGGVGRSGGGRVVGLRKCDRDGMERDGREGREGRDNVFSGEGWEGGSGRSRF